jgi:hypothetical protein
VESRNPQARLSGSGAQDARACDRCSMTVSTGYALRTGVLGRKRGRERVAAAEVNIGVWRQTSSRSRCGVRDWHGVDNGSGRVDTVSGQTGPCRRAMISSTRSTKRPFTTGYRRRGVCACIGGLGSGW